jgi:hypothetical protein
MTGALAIGAVSAVLRDLLDNGLVDAPAVGPVKVTAVAPDTIKLDDTNFGRQLNLFLYAVRPNHGWSNTALPSRASNGARLTNPPLALDLHFLLTAYGKADFEAEILLGYAMQLLHERPVLDRASIRKSLAGAPIGGGILPPAYAALSASDLADQIENVKITLDPMDIEEMSKLWSATQSHYRPTAAYIASVVLISATAPTKPGLPVLTRSITAHPNLDPPLPTLSRIIRKDHDQQPAVRLGETIRIEGYHLDGTNLTVTFDHPQGAAPNTIAIAANDDPNAIELTLPIDPDDPNADAVSTTWPAGIWSVGVELTRPGEPVPRSTTVAAMLLAPVPMLTPPPPLRAQFSPPVLTRDPSGNLSVTLMVEPHVLGSQRATLALGADEAIAEPHTGVSNTLVFEFGNVPAGARWVRLTVDGVESLLVDRSTTPPSYDATQSEVVPA